MKSKALFLSLVFAWATTVSSLAQVYSVNAVGYVNVAVHPGFNLISNPMLAATNTIGALFVNMQGGVPGGTTVYKLVNGQYITATWDDLENQFLPEEAAEEIVLPGDGVFVFLPNATDKVLTFVGEVPQGELCTTIPRGFSIKASVVPQTLRLDSYGFPATPGDVVYLLNRVTKSFDIYQVDDFGSWTPFAPTIEDGHAFLIYHPSAAVSWCRTFFIIGPR